MTYGDGDGLNYGPLTSTDIVGHEITHAITENSAGLIYSNESGALNESFSDIFGVAVDYYANPTTANFLVGDEFALNGQAFRDMSNPNAYGDPDTYLGNYWYVGSVDNGGVHTNSGVQNYWFYLLCSGGNGTNDLGNTFNVSSIGITAAAAIAYRTLTLYLTANSDYADMRTYSIQSAIDLYGICSNEVIQVTNAWYAVGVGAAYTNMVIANFDTPVVSLCGAPANVSFQNLSVNALNYLWDFGDNTTSTLTNPLHVYMAPGSYTVRLIVTGNPQCNFANMSDTLTYPNYINISNAPVPIYPSCAPMSGAISSASYGITKVELNTINHTSLGAIEGYKDFICVANTSLEVGSQYIFNVNAGNNSNYIKAWIDYDNDGIFSSFEQIADFLPGANTYQSVLTIPTNGVVFDTPLRMRVLSDNLFIANACQNPNNGQAEDYQVLIHLSTIAPIANFAMSDTIIAVGMTVDFTDLSLHGPNSWAWTINGGSPNSSNLQNISATFSAVGDYNIQLIASNSYGSDTINKVVHVLNDISLCLGGVADTTSILSGLLYDSGGLGGNYQNNENCSLLIAPGNCTDSIRLSFLSFHTQYSLDYLSIYDGSSASAPLLLSASSSTLPPSVSATSGSMFIKWHSSASSTYAGFSAYWQTYQHTPVAPMVNFSMNPLNPPLLDTVFFQDLSANNAVSWLWDFGDGTTSTQQHPNHQYTLSGTFSVSLIASACGGVSDTLIQNIVVQASPNIAFSPNTFTINLGCNDTVSFPFYIQNTNGGMLNWNISTQSNVTPNVLIWVYGVDMNPNQEYDNMINALNQYTPNYIFSTTATTNPAIMQGLLQGKTTLLIPENETGLSAVVNQFSTVIQDFVSNGGTVIVCGDYTVHTWKELGIFTGNVGAQLPWYQNLTFSNTSTPLTYNLPNNIQTGLTTFYDKITNSNKNTILSYTTGGISYDIVSSVLYGQGKAIYLGFDFYSPTAHQNQLLANAVEWSGLSSINAVLNVSNTSGNLSAGNTDTTYLEIYSGGMSGGNDTIYVVVQSNDFNNSLDSIPVYLNISTLPCAYFGANINAYCTGIVTFLDSTTNNPTTWLWDFGDGTTSTLQNPIHTYNNAGTYNVNLIVNSVIGSDSITKVIIVPNAGGTIPALCTPTAANPSSLYGTTLVHLNTIHHASLSALEGYKDFTCTDVTTVHKGSQYLFNINTASGNNKVKTWIDYNNNSTYDNSELIADFGNGSNTYQSLVHIPQSGTVLNTPLRMRVLSDSYSAFPNGNCQGLTSGQIEDYSVIITASNIAPTANFIMSDSTVVVGDSVKFWDLSQNSPTNWHWLINGTNPNSSTLQNPIGVFISPGTYNVRLIVGNSYGNDTLIKVIQVNPTTNTFILSCSGGQTQTTNALYGTLYDIGGPTGGYQYYNDCSFLISGNACTDTIFLSFSAFDTDTSDTFKVYDGTSANGTLLLSASGNTLPNGVKATSGNMFIDWNVLSNGTSWYDGFIANWEISQVVYAVPIANFNFNTNNLPVASTIYFQDLSSNNVNSWAWDFGDGYLTNIQNPSHSYALPGIYPVTLIVTSCGGVADTISQNVTVQGAPSFAISPNSYNISLGCNDTITLPLYIHNTNGGALNWNILNPNMIAANVLIWSYGVDMTATGEYNQMIDAINGQTTNYVFENTMTIDPSVLQNLLQNKTALLIPENENGLLSVVSSFAPVIQNFVQNGGTLIVCGDVNINVWNNIGIFTGSVGVQAGSLAPIVNSTTPLTHTLGNSVQCTYHTYANNITNTNKIPIISYLSVTGTKDIVTCMPYGQGRAIYMGYDFENYNDSTAKILANAIEWSGTSTLASQISLSAVSGTLLSGKTDTVYVKIPSNGVNGGLDTTYIVLETNDLNNSIDSIAIYTNISINPCVNFGIKLTNNCNSNILFIDSTTNAPTTWLWKFGDGNTSTLQHPVHTYAASGVYNVTLIASNATGIDSLTKPLSILNTSGAITAACIPMSVNPTSSFGIKRVKLNTINKTSLSAVEGYKDFTCEASTTLSVGTSYILEVTLFGTNDNVKAWIDYDNNGAFSNAEEITSFFTGATTIYTTVITIPTSGVTLNTPLRLRIIAEDGGVISSCNNLFSGQAEDYQVIIQAPTAPPIANFWFGDSIIITGTTVNFYDVSSNTPTTWNWTLNGGSTTSSTLKNPTATFNVVGTYAIQLIASNAWGSDTISKNIYVLPYYSVCAGGNNQISTDLMGMVYGSQGPPSGNFGANEDCSLLISPGSCTDSIRITFNSFMFDYNSDYVHVYDGNGPNGILLLELKYSTPHNPAPTAVATSGNMYIQSYCANNTNSPGHYIGMWQAYQNSNVLPIIANFTFSPTNPDFLGSVLFHNLSSSFADTYFWDFGDGFSSNLENPSHQYAVSGTYQIMLIVSACGQVDTAIQNITIAPAPTVNISPTSFTLSMSCADSVSLPIYIQHTNGGTLNWNISSSNDSISTTPDILFWTYGVDVTDYNNVLNAIIYNSFPNYTNFVYTSTNTTNPATMQNMLQGKTTLIIPENTSGDIAVIVPFASVIQDFVQNGGTLIVFADNHTYTWGNIGIFSGTSNSYTGSIQNVYWAIVNTNTPLTNGISGYISVEDAYYNTLTNPNKISILVDTLGTNIYDIISYLPYGQGKAIYMGMDDPNLYRFLQNAVKWSGYVEECTVVNPLSGTLTSGNTDTAYLHINTAYVQGGLDTLYLSLQTNDLAHLNDSIAIYVSMPPCVYFSDSLLAACSGFVSFSYNSTYSTNLPNSWLWKFGDGSTSTAQNPIHYYANPGTYTVTLIASNIAGSDSATQTVVIANVTGPVNACIPASRATANDNYGIVNVTFNTINNSSQAASVGYEDFSCGISTTLQLTNYYTLSVTTSSTDNKVCAWIDFNNDGTLQFAEILMNNFSSNILHQQTFYPSVPGIQTVLNVPLRLRIITDNDYISSSCDSLDFGQAEDYSVVIVNTISASTPLETAINVYPNPFQTEFVVELLNEPVEKEFELSISNMLGQVVYQKTYTISNNEKYVVPAPYSAGVYSLQVKLGNKQFIQKLIKE